ncbi:unnamed protein product [Arctogadus glacialis]
MGDGGARWALVHGPLAPPAMTFPALILLAEKCLLMSEWFHTTLEKREGEKLPDSSSSASRSLEQNDHNTTRSHAGAQTS